MMKTTNLSLLMAITFLVACTADSVPVDPTRPVSTVTPGDTAVLTPSPTLSPLPTQTATVTPRVTLTVESTMTAQPLPTTTPTPPPCLEGGATDYIPPTGQLRVVYEKEGQRWQ